jgi:Integrase core domain
MHLLRNTTIQITGCQAGLVPADALGPTMQCECVEYHTYLLRQGNQKQFNQNLEEWNNWYNHQRPHTSLQYLSPMQYFIQQLQS